MRMWMIDPVLLCREHLLGSHSEIHKHRHNFVKKHNMRGRLQAPAQIAPLEMESRHDELVKEMKRRDYNHNSPYSQPDVSYLGKLLESKVDLDYNIRDLMNRCPECKSRIEKTFLEGVMK